MNIDVSYFVSAARKLYCDPTQSLNPSYNVPSNVTRFHAINEYYPPCNFQFPPPPQHQIMCNSSRLGSNSCRNDLPSSSDESDTSSDSSQSDFYPLMPKMPSNRSNTMYKFRGYLSDGSPVSNILSILPPIGVFWDIENCQVRIKFSYFHLVDNKVVIRS